MHPRRWYRTPHHTSATERGSSSSSSGQVSTWSQAKRRRLPVVARWTAEVDRVVDPIGPEPNELLPLVREATRGRIRLPMTIWLHRRDTRRPISIFHWACWRGSVPLVWELLTLPHPPSILHHGNYDAWLRQLLSPLEIALLQGNTELSDLLRRAGAPEPPISCVHPHTARACARIREMIAYEPWRSHLLPMVIASELIVHKASYAEIPQGQWSCVYKGTYNGQALAVKEMVWSSEASWLDRLCTEVAVHYGCRGAVPLVGIVATDTHFQIITEWAEGGTLEGKLPDLTAQRAAIDKVELSEDEKVLLRLLLSRDIAYPLCRHLCWVQHGDIRLSNVLLSGPAEGGARVMLGDFGFASTKALRLREPRTRRDDPSNDYFYAVNAPEVVLLFPSSSRLTWTHAQVLAGGPYNEKAELW